MLTTTPNQGDIVLVVPKTGKTNDRESRLLSVEKVGRKWLYLKLNGVSQQFTFEGRNDWFELWDSQEAYNSTMNRSRSIARIQRIVATWSRNNELSDETLAHVLGLIDVKK